jgi:hypothetical protein
MNDGYSAIAAGLRGYVDTHLQNANIEAGNRLSAANASAGNRVRLASNTFSAARGALARYIQSLRNGQVLAAGGEALEANIVNARRQDDGALEAGFERSIKHTEQLGAQAAAAAFAGVGGEVADMVSLSTRLMQQRVDYAAARSRDFSNYDAARRGASIVQQTVRGLDNSLILDSIDYTIDVAQRRQRSSAWVGALLAAGDSYINSGQGWQTKDYSGRSNTQSYGNYNYGNGQKNNGGANGTSSYTFSWSGYDNPSRDSDAKEGNFI